MMRKSLTLRLALILACMSFATIAALGTALYFALAAQLRVRDDGALVTRVDQIRTILQDGDARALIREKPALFGNMLGNTESLLVVRIVGGTALLVVNPGHRPIPDIAPVAGDAPLTLRAVHHGAGPDGTPFIYTAAEVRASAGQSALEVLSGRMLTERTQTLAHYRDGILLASLLGAILLAALAFGIARRSMAPLQRLAERTAGIGVGTLSLRIDQHRLPEELDAVVVQFNAMLDRLESGFAQLKQVSADMAHDLRTPINNMLGQIEVGLGQARDIPYYQRLVGSNYEELQRLSRMIDNMLFIARAEHAADTADAIDAEDLDVDDALRRLCDYFEDLAAERNVTCTYAGTGTIRADETLLQRAVANLMSNALRYATPGSEIALVATQAENETAITVTNDGPTVAADVLSRVFDRFYRGDASRRQSSESSGLGLSIVQSIMHLHGGRCSAESQDGTTCFTLVFPKAPHVDR